MSAQNVDLKPLIAAIHEEVEKTLASSFCDPDAEAFAGSVLALVDTAVVKSVTADSADVKRIGYPFAESKMLFFGRELRARLIPLYGCNVELVPYGNDKLLDQAKYGNFEYLIGRESQLRAAVDASAEVVSITIPRTFKDASSIPLPPGM